MTQYNIIIIIKIAIFFLLPANIILVLLLKNKFDKFLGNLFLVLISYGIAPLLSGLVFYYMIIFLPGLNSWWYLSVHIVFWVFIGSYINNMQSVISVYKDLIKKVKNKYSIFIIFVGIISFCFFILFSLQALLYPIAEGDSAYYYMQSKALSQSRDAKWYKNGTIMLEHNEYSYNPMIRPGIPATIASMSLMNHNEDHLLFRFLSVYYYVLLLGIIVCIVSKLAQLLHKDELFASAMAIIMVIFYWSMTRFYIFNNKEVIIYFMALASLYLVYKIIILNKHNFKIEFLLGLLIGLNSFVNLHGTIIGIFLLVVLFAFSKLPIKARFMQIVTVGSVSLFLSAFEAVRMFSFLFLETFRGFLEKYTEPFVNINIAKLDNSNKTLNTVAIDHRSMYQMKNVMEVYLKGKLQIFTNIGAYGIYAQIFMVIVLIKFKDIYSTVLGRVYLIFMGVYFFIMMDPLSLNKHPLAVVLWGSPKYSMLLGLLSIIIVAVYFKDIIKIVNSVVCRSTKSVIFISVGLFISGYFMKNTILIFGLTILVKVVKVSREIAFYEEKIKLIYGIFLALLGIFMVVFIVLQFLDNNRKYLYNLAAIFCLTVVVIPFFIVPPGKVSAVDTIILLKKDNNKKLQRTIFFGDLFKVYYYAKRTLPKGTVISTPFLELYAQNNYFNLRGYSNQDAKYTIVATSCKKNIEAFKSGPYSLCWIGN